MKTAHESLLGGSREVKDRRPPPEHCPPPTRRAIGERRAASRPEKVAQLRKPATPLSAEEELENTLAAELRVGLRNGHDTPATHDRRVLLDKEVSGYRLVLIRETPDPLSGINLSPREREIARLIAKGYPNKSIAAVLEISCWTVGTHLRRVFAKLGVTCRAAMVARLMELGLTGET